MFHGLLSDFRRNAKHANNLRKITKQVFNFNLKIYKQHVVSKNNNSTQKYSYKSTSTVPREVRRPHPYGLTVNSVLVVLLRKMYDDWQIV